jgi:hypothetical protein
MGRHRFGAIAVGFIIVLLSTALAEAVEISTGPLRVIAFGDDIVCIAANTGATNIANVVIRVKYRKLDGTSNAESGNNCGTLSPDETCQVDSTGVGNDYAMFCEVTFGGGKLRATLCNITRALCSNAD